MQEIKVVYLHLGNPYRLGSHKFNTDHLMVITASLQKNYFAFAERINQQDGYLELNISCSKIFDNGIHYEAFIMGSSKELIDEINAWECNLVA